MVSAAENACSDRLPMALTIARLEWASRTILDKETDDVDN